MRLTDDCQTSYAAADLETKRRWNRAVYKRILVSRQRVKRVEYQEPYLTLFSWAGSNKETVDLRLVRQVRPHAPASQTPKPRNSGRE